MSLLIPNHHPINPDGLVLWLDYKNTGSVAATGTWKDYSGNGNDGTLVGDAYVDNGGLDLDGAGDYVDVGNGYGYTSSSISQWVYLRSIPPVSTTFGIGVDNSDLDRWGIIVRSSNNKFTIFNDIDNLNLDYTGTTTVNTGQWYHLVAVINGSSHKLYVNGALDASGTTPKTWADLNSQSAYVGALPVGSPVPGLAFNGKIDEVMIFNRALSVGEIQTMYQRTLRA